MRSLQKGELVYLVVGRINEIMKSVFLKFTVEESERIFNKGTWQDGDNGFWSQRDLGSNPGCGTYSPSDFGCFMLFPWFLVPPLVTWRHGCVGTVLSDWHAYLHRPSHIPWAGRGYWYQTSINRWRQWGTERMHLPQVTQKEVELDLESSLRALQWLWYPGNNI